MLVYEWPGGESADSQVVVIAGVAGGRRVGVEGEMMSEGYMRRKEAAKYLGISERTLSLWMRNHVVPYRKVSRRVVLFDRESLDLAIAMPKLNADDPTNLKEAKKAINKVFGRVGVNREVAEESLKKLKHDVETMLDAIKSR